MLRSNLSGQSSQPITLVIEVGDVDLDACKIFINRGKGAKDRYILFPASFRLVKGRHFHHKEQRKMFFTEDRKDHKDNTPSM
jgi:hypothetical protein